jgi:hypothetical protein
VCTNLFSIRARHEHRERERPGQKTENHQRREYDEDKKNWETQNLDKEENFGNDLARSKLLCTIVE